jgi:Rod binding domain-containing protein
MNSVDPVSPQARASEDTGHEFHTPRKIQEAGQQFESLLIAELLKGTHSEDGGWLGSGGDSATACAMGVAEESLAQTLASQGGFGLANMVTKSLTAAAGKKV